MRRDLTAFLVVLLLCLGPAAQMGGSDYRSSDRGPVPLDSSDFWTDTLDDSNHVYTMIDVAVVSGEARLAAGRDNGWIASEVIHAKVGHRYDFVLLEATTPGNSSVEISILDAGNESSEVGFANETIMGLIRVKDTYLSVYEVPPAMYPDIRIQVNLVADGTDRPVLKEWSLYHVPEDEWRDDFLTDRKMWSHQNVNLTAGALEINMSGSFSPGVRDYPSYPTMVSAYVNVNLWYPNSARTGYQAPTSIDLGQTFFQPACGDLNGDGMADFVLPVFQGTSSVILWGSSSGTYSASDITELPSQAGRGAAVGDFNGDGWSDVAIGYYIDTTDSGVLIFLNRGGGSFNDEADIRLTERGGAPAVGDFNADGYDDIVYEYNLHYGEPDGPSSPADVTFGQGMSYVVKDVNGDGIEDLISRTTQRIYVFLGSLEGLNRTPVQTISGHGFQYRMADVGDFNGDGFVDLLVLGREPTTPNPQDLIIFEGTADGFVDTSYHTVMTNLGYGDIVVGDIDRDGYDDIVSITSTDSYVTNYMRVFLGGSSWPTSPADTTQSTTSDIYLALSIIRDLGGGGRHMGILTTSTIDLPPDSQWDIVHIDGTLPQNTSMRFSVLDATGKRIPGYSDITDTDVDLSDLSPTLYKSIMLRFNLESQSNSTTPVLDRITVKWMGLNCWRDEFYGQIRTERTIGLGIKDGELVRATMGTAPQLLYTSLRGPEGFDIRPIAYIDGGNLDYMRSPPIPFEARGVAAVDANDVNGDGFTDLVFATHQTSDSNFATTSPLFLGSATGWKPVPDHTYPTTGATDVLLEDLDDDGHVDVVFAQEMKAQDDFLVNSTLFWGSASGWNDTPDVEFVTTGAADVEAFDHDGDGDLDLVFACYKASSTDIDSMVFTQGPSGFDGSSPSILLDTKAARGVAAGDLDGDGHADLVFANSMAGGLAEIDSFIYWGNSGGGFDTSPTRLPTMGAEDVVMADVDGDGDLDIVFANSIDNSQSREVSSYVYLNDGSGGFQSSPDRTLPATGAVAVAVADLDGTGWKDLVFACQYNGTSYDIDSCVYLGGASGWSPSPDILLPTEGASDVMVAQFARVGYGGYVSKTITPDPNDDPGGFHTFRYTADIGPSQKGTVQLVDAVTEEILGSTTLVSGTHEWSLVGLFSYKEHPSIRVVVIGEGLNQPGSFSVDEVWLNWTKRVRLPPEVHGISVSEPSVYRLQTVRLDVNVTDEYDLPEELLLTVMHRSNGTEDWSLGLLEAKTFKDGVWSMDFSPRVDTAVGSYDLRVMVRDADSLESGWVEFPNMLEVLNNVPTAPEIRLLPARADTTSTLSVEFVRGAQDVEGTPLTYSYLWYLSGELQPLLVTESVDPSLTEKGQNWSVHVVASDGEDEGPAATAWLVIHNALPRTAMDLPDPSFEEDTSDSDWLDLLTAFEDPDGDVLTWSIETPPIHLTVDIDPVTGKVTLTPEENWNGQENITFLASDGENTAWQLVTVYVTAVNDVPWFATVNGEPVGDGPVEMTIKQGELLSIDVLVVDPEGDELVFDVNTTLFQVDGSTGAIRWQPENDQVGTLRFAMTVWDVVTASAKVSLDFVITVENENDPMDDPRITAPQDMWAFEEGTKFSLIATCTDPDTRYGQILNFSWSSNMSGLLGYGPSLSVALDDVGTHVITLSVTDGEFQKTATVTVVIKAKEEIAPLHDGNGGEEGINYGLVAGIVVALVVIGVLILVARTRKKTEELEAEDETEYEREHMERAYEAVKAAADHMEAEKEEPVPIEQETMEVATGITPDGQLSMQAAVTEVPSQETITLFTGISTAEPIMSEEEQEQLRLDNLKRKYQNAIGRLPYGIPSKELADREWVELASALATGEKKTLPDGAEVTEIEGRWYHSDVDDTGTFLKEHGAKKDAPRKAEVVPADKTALLAKLEERFILGEISEEAYNKLLKKYRDE